MEQQTTLLQQQPSHRLLSRQYNFDVWMLFPKRLVYTLQGLWCLFCCCSCCQRQTDLGFRLTRRRSVGHRDVINHTKPILESSKSGRTRRPKGGVSLEKSFRSKLFPLFWFSGCCCYHFFSSFFSVCLFDCLFVYLFVCTSICFFRNATV